MKVNKFQIDAIFEEHCFQVENECLSEVTRYGAIERLKVKNAL